MAGAFVQASAGVYNGFGGNAIDSLSGVTSGNAFIAICLATADPTAIATSNFSGSGAFTKQVAGSALGGGLLLSIWDYYSALSGSHTITATAVGGSGVQMIVLEVSGIASFTAASTLAQGVSNSPTANSLTPVSGSWNLGVSYNGAAQTYSGWSPGTEIFDYAAWRGLAGSEYTAPSTSGIVTSASLGASDFWYAQTCSFAVSGGGGGASIVPLAAHQYRQRRA